MERALQLSSLMMKATMMILALVMTVGCGHAPPPEPVTQSQVAVEPAGELEPRTPARRDAAMVAGTREPVDPVAAVETPEPQEIEGLEPIDVAELRLEEHLELAGDDLIVEGMAIRNLPDGVQVYRVRALPETFELRRDGERIALIERAPWSYAARASRRMIGPETRPVEVTTWDEEPVEVVLERRSFEGWRYQIERRPTASWLALRLELGDLD